MLHGFLSVGALESPDPFGGSVALTVSVGAGLAMGVFAVLLMARQALAFYVLGAAALVDLMCSVMLKSGFLVLVDLAVLLLVHVMSGQAVLTLTGPPRLGRSHQRPPQG